MITKILLFRTIFPPTSNESQISKLTVESHQKLENRLLYIFLPMNFQAIIKKAIIWKFQLKTETFYISTDPEVREAGRATFVKPGDI